MGKRKKIKKYQFNLEETIIWGIALIAFGFMTGFVSNDLGFLTPKPTKTTTLESVWKGDCVQEKGKDPWEATYSFYTVSDIGKYSVLLAGCGDWGCRNPEIHYRFDEFNKKFEEMFRCPKIN